MNSKEYRNGKFKAVIPSNWAVEEDEDESIISLYNPEEGVGALQFSLFSVENPLNIDLEKDLRDLLENPFIGEITVRDNCAETFYLDKEIKKHWRYWLIKKENLIIFGSYNCDDDDKEIESDVVQEIINSIIRS
jgi:hypothetical protein